MAVVNFLAVLFVAVAVWSVFTIFGEPWETSQGRMVQPAGQVLYADDTEIPMPPDTMPVSSIGDRPDR